MKRLLIVLGAAVAGVSLLFLTAAVVELATGTNLAGTAPTPSGILTAFAALFAAATAGGAYLIGKGVSGIRTERKRLEDRARTEKERIVLRLIENEHGTTTPLETTTRTGLPVEEARRILDDLTTRLGGDIRVTEDGGMVYVFDVTSKHEKNSAKRLTDT